MGCTNTLIHLDTCTLLFSVCHDFLPLLYYTHCMIMIFMYQRDYIAAHFFVLHNKHIEFSNV